VFLPPSGTSDALRRARLSQCLIRRSAFEESAHFRFSPSSRRAHFKWSAGSICKGPMDDPRDPSAPRLECARDETFDLMPALIVGNAVNSVEKLGLNGGLGPDSLD
jgi:hypothetical protein